MNDTLSRRRLLYATGGAGAVGGLAGCLSSFSSGDSSDDPDESDGPRHESPCDAVEAYARALFDAEFETVVEYRPYEYTDEYTRDELLKDLREWDAAVAAETEQEVDDISITEFSCERSSPEFDAALVDDRYAATVSSVVRLESAVTVEHPDGPDESLIVDPWAELDGEWYLIDRPSPAELTVEVIEDSQVVEADATGEAAAVVVSVIDEDGNPVGNATVLASAGSARLEGVVDAETGIVGDEVEGTYDLADHEAVLALDGRQSLRESQDVGTIELDVVPPSDTNYIDERPNPEIAVVAPPADET